MKRGLSLLGCVLFGVLVATVYAFGQNSECGTVVTPEQLRFELDWQQRLAAHPALRTSDHYDIPLAIHIVRQSSGVGGLTLDQLQAAIDSSNIYAAQTNVSLFQYGSVDYIDNDGFYFGTNSLEQYDALRQTNQVVEGVNIYFVPETSISGFPYCGLSSFSSSLVQGIILNNTCVDPVYSKTTLFHEVGHYFNLYHTHETAFGIECPSGTNCGLAGDLICDTPADPDLNGHVSGPPECVYDQYASTPGDCDATPYNPPVKNVMSYSSKNCRTDMSVMQNEKFRLTLETERLGLAYGVNGFRLTPSQVVNWPVLPGTIRDTVVKLSYVDADTVTVEKVVTTTGKFQVSAALPAAIYNSDTLSLAVTFDARNMAGPCALGQYVDTLVITTLKPGTSPLRVPLSVNVSYGLPTYSEKQIGPACLPLNVPITPGIGNGWANSLMLMGKGVLVDGSLLIATRSGADTTAYMDLYQRNDFTGLKDYTPGVDALGRVTQTTSFVTKDGHFAGDVTYTYGRNSYLTDSCVYYIVDYQIKNPCDTALTFLSGVFCDYDVDYNMMQDKAWALPSDSAVVMSDWTGSRAGALVLLNSCNRDQRFRAVDNVVEVWGSNGLPSGAAYRLMADPTPSPTLSGTDVSALLSFGPTRLETGGVVHYRFALAATYNGPTWMPQIMANLRTVGANADDCPYVPGDANGDGVVDISDPVHLIAYIFSGGPAPFPTEAGDANCSGAVDISDVVYLIQYIFGGGPAPC
jgi:hypothetical protein